MNNSMRRFRGWRNYCFLACVAAVLGACQTPSPTQPAADGQGATAPEPEPSTPRDLPTTRESKAQAAKYALDAMEMLQNGEEAAAKAQLERALLADPSNEIARKLMDQIRADPVQELGAVYFRYTVRSEDSLSKLAQRFLNDRYRFYILAKYNDLRVPNKLEVGQVVKIPGKEPPPSLTPPITHPAKAAEPAPRAIEPPVRPTEVAPRATETPPPRPAADKAQTVRRLSREAEVCYQRDRNLDCAIEKWGQVLAIDPDNQLVKLKRERAIGLKEQLRRESK